MSLSTVCSVSSSEGEPFPSISRSRPSASFSIHFPHIIHAPDPEKERVILRIFQEISSKYRFQMRTFCDNQVVQLTNPENGRSTRVIGHSFDINSAAAQECCKDRTATYQLLREAGIPVIESKIFFRDDPETMESIYSYAWRHNNAVLCRPVGTSNEKEEIHVNNREELNTAVQNLFQHFQALYISPYDPIVFEYRVIMFNASAELAIKRINPQTEMDEESIEIIAFRRVTSRSPISSPLGISPQDFQTNQVISIAHAAAKALEIAFCSINIAQMPTGELKIRNINPEVTIEQFLQPNSEPGYRTAKCTYEKVICQLLEKPVIPEFNAVHPLMSTATLCRVFDPLPPLDLTSLQHSLPETGPAGLSTDSGFEASSPPTPPIELTPARKRKEE